MATLVQFLVAGVKGAESGTATFVFRGTASSAASALYNDFERTAQPGTNIITLDANGAAEVYCSAYCDVTLKNSAGTTLRTVTIANSDDLVEVRSDSFTGDDYDGSPAGVESQPVTLGNVLDRWNNSAGASDWKVLVNSVATNIQTAFASFAGIFINVKDPTYGAVGDGVTSDTTAITNALAAVSASGGVLVFPPGTYLCGQILVTAANFAMVAFGQATIKGTSGSTFVIQDNTPGAVKLFSGLRFEGNGSAVDALSFEGDNTAYVDGCTFDQSGYTTGLIQFNDDGGRYYVTRCRFDLASGKLSNAIRHRSGDGKQVLVSDCLFTIPASFTTRVIAGACFSVDNCVFDGEAVTSGAYYHIDATHPTDTDFASGNVSNCTFIDGGSSGYVFYLRELGPGCDFTEENNSFIGFTGPTTMADPGHFYDYSNAAGFDYTSRIVLGSRRGRQLTFANTAAGGTVSGVRCFMAADTIVVNQTDDVNTGYYMDSAEAPIGLQWRMVILNNSANSHDLAVSGTAALVGESTVVAGGRAMFDVFSYLEAAGSVDCDVMASAKASV